MVSDQRRRRRIDHAAFGVHSKVVSPDADGLEHRDHQSGFVLAVAVAVAIDIAGVMRLPSSDPFHDDEVADVFLDVARDTAQLGVEIGRTGHKFLRFGRNLRCWIGTMSYKLILPQAECLPLFRRALDSRVSPHHRHVCGQRLRRRNGVEIFQIESRNVCDFPTQMAILCLDGPDWVEVAPRVRIVAVRRQSQLKSFVHDRDRVLYPPNLGVHVRPQMSLEFASDDCAGVAAGRLQDAETIRFLHVCVPIGSDVRKVCIHGLELPPIRGNGPGVKVIQLFVCVILRSAVTALPSLRLEYAHGRSHTLDGVILLVHCNQILIEQDDGGGIANIYGRRRFGGFNCPIRRGLRFLLGSAKMRAEQHSGAAACDNKNSRYGDARPH